MNAFTSRRALLAASPAALLAVPAAAPAPCPIAAMAPAMQNAFLAANALGLGGAAGTAFSDFEEAAMAQPARSAAGALLQVMIAHADVVTVLDTDDLATRDEDLLARAERGLWSAISALRAAGVTLPAELADFYTDAHMNPFAGA